MRSPQSREVGQPEYRIGSVLFDPYQMQRSTSALRGAGVLMVEYPQTSGNLTAAGQALYDLIRDRRLRMYADGELR